MPKAPAGSLIQDPAFPGAFHSVGDVDAVTLDLDTAQSLTVVLDPDGTSLRGRIELLDPNGVSVATAVAGADGATVVIQTAPVASAGTYRIEATSIGGTGRYALSVLLNAAAEGENVGVGANDTIGTAQALTGGLTGLHGGADTLAVLGSVGRARDDLYSVDPFDALLHRLDPETGATIDTRTITLAGRVINGATGLARHPITGELWALLKLSGQGGRELVRLDLATGIATSAGDTGDNFAGVAFDAAGTLYGVTGDGGSTPETLFTLSTDDGIPTLVRALGGGDNGEALAFDPVTGRLLHASGDNEQVFESLTPPGFGATPLPLSGALAGRELGALTYWADRDRFLLVTDQNELVDLGRDGRAGTRRQLDHSMKGLAIVPGVGPADLADIYRLTLAPGQVATIVVEGASAPATVELLDAVGARVTTAVAGPSNVDAVIRDLVTPAGGTFFLRVTALEATDYSLVVTRGATFELEPDDTATLTFSLWDLDSGSSGNQVTAFSLDGVPQDLATFEANEPDLAVI